MQGGGVNAEADRKATVEMGEYGETNVSPERTAAAAVADE